MVWGLPLSRLALVRGGTVRLNGLWRRSARFAKASNSFGLCTLFSPSSFHWHEPRCGPRLRSYGPAISLRVDEFGQSLFVVVLKLLGLEVGCLLVDRLCNGDLCGLPRCATRSTAASKLKRHHRPPLSNLSEALTGN